MANNYGMLLSQGEIILGGQPDIWSGATDFWDPVPGSKQRYPKMLKLPTSSH